MITIDEQIEYMQSIVATSMLPTHMPKAILASLERLKRIDEVQVPDEPQIWTLESGKMVAVSKDAHFNEYVWAEDYDTLRDLLKQAQNSDEHNFNRWQAAESKLAAIELELARLNGEIPYGN
jgi:hypothetical protein